MIKVDTSGRGFERMCVARKTMVNVPLSIGEHNNLNDEIQTVKRRSRSRKPRNKRRNTIAGTDQKEIEEAVKGYVTYFLVTIFFLRICCANRRSEIFEFGFCCKKYLCIG